MSGSTVPPPPDGGLAAWPHVFVPGEAGAPVLLTLHGTGGTETEITALATHLDPRASVLSPWYRMWLSSFGPVSETAGTGTPSRSAQALDLASMSRTTIATCVTTLVPNKFCVISHPPPYPFSGSQYRERRGAWQPGPLE